MRNLLFILALCLLSVPSFGQAAKEPFKNANVIIVQLPDSNEVAWRRVARDLSGLGYVLSTSSIDLLTLSTEAKLTANKAVGLAPSVIIKGAILELRGKTGMPGFDGYALTGPRTAAEYRGMKGGMYMIAWEELTRVASALGTIKGYVKR